MKILHKKLLTSVLCIFLSILIYKFWSASEISCIRYSNTSYTYIIVGAGTAGCVLAARLTKNKENTVLIIEAGGNFNFVSKIPLAAVFLQKSQYDWLYESEPQKWSSWGFHNKKQTLPRGKGLGGSGQLNFLIYNGINSKTLPPVQESLIKFIRSKKCLQTKCDYVNYLFLGPQQKSKPLDCTPAFPINLQKSKSHLGKIFKKAITQLRDATIKYYSALSTIFKGERWSTYRSHLLPIHNRANLHIMCNAEATKIIIENKRAIGVQVSNRSIYSKSEIILSAGSINTPKLLLLSGIGNEQELTKLNISTIVHLPGVGLNLHDHIAMPLYVKIKAPLSLTIRQIASAQEIFNYVVHRNGLFASSPVAAIVKSTSNFLILFIGATPEYPFHTASNYLSETFRNIFPFYNSFNQEGFVILAGCRETKSRGFVKLNENKSVIIDPQYLIDKHDVTCIKDAMKLAFSVVNSTAFQEIGASIHLPTLKQCDYKADFSNDDYLNCIIRTGAITNYHQAGTCRMGQEDDAYSVVDHNFRVKNIDGLRIVDGSILPNPTNNFPNAVIAMVAEYAATLFT